MVRLAQSTNVRDAELGIRPSPDGVLPDGRGVPLAGLEIGSDGIKTGERYCFRAPSHP